MKSLACSVLDPEDTPTVRLGALVRTPAAVVTARTPLADVRRLLVQRRVPAIVVVDDGRTLCGLVTRTDVLRAGDDRATAGDVMSGFVFALPATSAIDKAAALMAYEGVGQIVVTSARGELVGMVSAVDLARHYAIAAGYLALEPRAGRLEVGPLVLDPVAMVVTVRGEPVTLTPNEFALVHALAQRPGRALDREQLLQLLHGTADEAFDRSIDVVVSRVRTKLELDPRNPTLLKTVRGLGYMLAPGS